MPTPATLPEALLAMCYQSVPEYDGLQRSRWTYADRALTVAALSGADAYNILYDAITLWPSIPEFGDIEVTSLTRYNSVITREENELALSGTSPDLLAPRDERWCLMRLQQIVYPLLGFVP